MPSPPERPQTISTRQALALGLLHGPTELLPVSSSGHTTLVPWLVGSSYPDHDPAIHHPWDYTRHLGDYEYLRPSMELYLAGSLDPDQEDGFVRDWKPLRSGPERNVGYAVQWFGLAAALLVIYLVVNTHKLT